MKTTIRYLLFAVAISVLSTPNLWADDPPTTTKGNVAVLEKDRILEGDIERIGDQYRIRRGSGETWLPAEKILHVCANLEEAHAYLRSQTNLDDPDERLRLARWCLLHNLRREALEEATAALELRPNHAESQRLARGLQRTVASEAQPSRPKDEPETEAATVANLPYNPEALGPFVTRVQPILMNTCATCHASGKSTTFKLIRGYDEGMLTNRKATQQNLMATLALLQADRPLTSPLLSYAVTLHGDADQPPLKGKNVPAYRVLEEWVQLAVANTPKTGVAATIKKPEAEVKMVGEGNIKLPAAEPAANPSVPAKESESWIPKPTTKPQALKPREEFAQPQKPAEHSPANSAEVEPADPFDPIIFNRQMQPPK
jgi:hypothetical protein